jgi:hypothetical protein
VRAVYFGEEQRSPPNLASSGAKLADTPTHESAGTDPCADVAGPEKEATFQVPNTGSLGAEAHAVINTRTLAIPALSLCITISVSIPPVRSTDVVCR